MTESRKIAVAVALSLLVHVCLFTALALMPANVSVPVTPEEKPLEVTFEAALPTPEFQANASLAEMEQGTALRTQLDPENLKAAEQAPENPTEIAAHDSKAAEGKMTPEPTPTPVPPPDPASLTVHPASAPTPKAEGEAGVDAVGNYGKAVGNAIGLRWEFYRKTQKDLRVGEVRIMFSIDAQGRTSDVQVLSNTAAPGNANVAVRAIKESRIPAIPPERLAQTSGGRMKIVYTFIIY